MKNKFLFYPIVLFLLLSCNNNDIYFRYNDIASTGWNKDSTMTFTVEIVDTTKTYNCYINVRNRGEYPNQNLWLFIEKESPDNVVTLDTINFYLADHRGKWLGSGVGSSYEMPVLYQQNIRYKQKGKYQFRINHGMRVEDLTGLSNIGIRVEKSN